MLNKIIKLINQKLKDQKCNLLILWKQTRNKLEKKKLKKNNSLIISFQICNNTKINNNNKKIDRMTKFKVIMH